MVPTWTVWNEPSSVTIQLTCSNSWSVSMHRGMSAYSVNCMPATFRSCKRIETSSSPFSVGMPAKTIGREYECWNCTVTSSLFRNTVPTSSTSGPPGAGSCGRQSSASPLPSQASLNVRKDAALDCSAITSAHVS